MKKPTQFAARHGTSQNEFEQDLLQLYGYALDAYRGNEEYAAVLARIGFVPTDTPFNGLDGIPLFEKISLLAGKAAAKDRTAVLCAIFGDDNAKYVSKVMDSVYAEDALSRIKDGTTDRATVCAELGYNPDDFLKDGWYVVKRVAGAPNGVGACIEILRGPFETEDEAKRMVAQSPETTMVAYMSQALDESEFEPDEAA